MGSTWPEIADKALDKLPVDKLYEDLLQPGFRKAGEALASVIDLTNTVLFPIAWLNGRRAIYLKDNLSRYQAKLDAVEEPVIAIPDSISIPILEKLSLITEQDLSEGFINLLAKASFESTVSGVHPSFVNTLANISSDEAKLLFSIKSNGAFPCMSCKTVFNRKSGKNVYSVVHHFSNLGEGVEFEFPKNIDLYIENLIRFDILRDGGTSFLEMEDDPYKPLKKKYIEKFRRDNPDVEIFETTQTPGFLHFSDYGVAFMKACMKDISDLSEWD